MIFIYEIIRNVVAENKSQTSQLIETDMIFVNLLSYVLKVIWIDFLTSLIFGMTLFVSWKICKIAQMFAFQ